MLQQAPRVVEGIDELVSPEGTPTPKLASKRNVCKEKRVPNSYCHPVRLPITCWCPEFSRLVDITYLTWYPCSTQVKFLVKIKPPFGLYFRTESIHRKRGELFNAAPIPFHRAAPFFSQGVALVGVSVDFPQHLVLSRAELCTQRITSWC